MNQNEEQVTSSKDLVQVPDNFLRFIWAFPLIGLLSKVWGQFKQMFRRRPQSYIIRCPKCGNGDVQLQKDNTQNLLKCEGCGYEFTVLLLEKLADEPSSSASLSTVVIAIGSPSSNWDSVKEGDLLGTILDKLTAENDLWFDSLPNKEHLSIEQSDEKNTLLLVISDVKEDGNDIFKQNYLSRIAILSLLENNSSAPIQQLIWTSSAQIRNSDLNLRRP
ncbi:MAG: eukaryotic translation initiation factor eIF-2-beta/eIF-5 family protein [Thermoguttaceae bacterium]|nr:eukaryotic translation initiation factor eIF-2-beta/eIF-5 family protein [Thermoguttaceae bacterium]